MAYEKLIKRTIFVAECECGHREEVDDNPPREKQCTKCKRWVKFKPVEWIGPDLGR